jgi:hypothetical protein
MSDVRFVRELGAEFERLERAGAAGSGRRRSRSSPARLPGRIAMGLAVAVPLAIAALAIANIGVSRNHAAPTTTTASSGYGFAAAGGNCLLPTRSDPHAPPTTTGPDGLISAASGRLSGIAWQVRVKPGTALPGAIAHGRLLVGAGEYGLCSRQSVPVPFGLINAGAHGIVYGYVDAGGGSYRVTVSAGAAAITSTVTDTFFFIRELPRPACAYRALTVTATSTPVAGMPPDISRSLDDEPTRFTTTLQFGDCHAPGLVTPVSEHGTTTGRSPNAPLARVTAQVKLVAPAGSGSNASGIVFELTHGGSRGINLLAFKLAPSRYGVWLLGPHGNATALAIVNVRRGEIQGDYDLPAQAGGRQIVIATLAPGGVDRPGRVVLRATLR